MKWLVISLLLFLFGATPVLAVTIATSNVPSSIGSDSFTLNVSVSGPSPGNNYLRVDLYKDGTHNYFGETFNGTDWHSDSTATNYFPITIDSNGTASAQLTARLGNPSTNDYPGSGDYKLKIRRYTSSGNAADDDQTPVNIAITYVFPTVIPTTGPTNTPIPAATSTPIPSATAVPTVRPTARPTASPTIVALIPTIGEEEFVTSQLLDFGESPPPTNTPAVLGESTTKASSIWPMIIIGAGVVGLIISLILLFLHSRKSASESGPINLS